VGVTLALRMLDLVHAPEGIVNALHHLHTEIHSLGKCVGSKNTDVFDLHTFNGKAVGRNKPSPLTLTYFS